MKKIPIIILAIVVVGAGVYYWQGNDSQNNNQQPSNAEQTNQDQVMNITSSAFENNQNIPAKYTCDGENINPPLEFKNVPANAPSLALVMDDPDAPSGTWVHWTIWNIYPGLQSLSENSAPQKAIEGKTSSGQNKYGGPCPPSGTHHYHFKLYALDVPKLELPSYSDKAALEEAMEGHIIEQAELIGLYSR